MLCSRYILVFLVHYHTSSCFDFNPVAISLVWEAIISNRLASGAVCACLILAMTLINFVLLFPAVFLTLGVRSLAIASRDRQF